MSLTQFQNVLSRLVMEPPFRRAVADDADSVLASCGLSERERRRLEALARDPGLRTGTLIHRSFRLSMLSNTLPRTCRALGGRMLKELVHDYWRREPSRSLVYVREALGFAAFARERFASGAIRHELMPEVLEAEVALLELADEAPATPTRPLRPLAPGDRLRLAQGHRLVPFRRPPEPVLAALAAGNEPPDADPPGAAGELVLLVSARGGSRVAMRTLEPAEGRLAIRCDGRAPLARIAGELPREDPPPERTAEALVGSGVLEPAPPADRREHRRPDAAIVAEPVSQLPSTNP